jgi:translation initiation factor 2 beta subunit (eIF-2beta)/eIF-5
VRGRRVRVSLADVRLRREPPERWSVVVRTGVLRPTLGGQGKEVLTHYVVCPHCQERQDYTGKPVTLACARCGATSAVDWSETC